MKTRGWGLFVRLSPPKPPFAEPAFAFAARAGRGHRVHLLRVKRRSGAEGGRNVENLKPMQPAKRIARYEAAIWKRGEAVN
jgi:hypothetical protein